MNQFTFLGSDYKLRAIFDLLLSDQKWLFISIVAVKKQQQLISTYYLTGVCSKVATKKS